jgi:hypothetical protein
VFRWQFDHNASGLQKGAQVYFLGFLGINKGDPSDEFMKRFTGNKPPVRKESECDTATGEALAKKTGESGLVFYVGHIDWKSDSEVDVEGGYYEGNLSASSNTYTLRKVNGKWMVIKDTLNGIS